MLQRILDHPDFPQRDLSPLRQISYGAAAAGGAGRRALDALPDVGFVNVFGQTETSAPTPPSPPRTTGPAGSWAPRAGPPRGRAADRRPGHRDRLPGRRGRPGVGAGGPERHPEWLRTGDLAFLDADGYLHPSGRLTDTINRGGEKFGPIEVERCCAATRPCATPASAACPIPSWGNGSRAVVVTVDGEASTPTTCGRSRRRLARYKRPERIVFADDLPYSNLGKVNRAALAAVILADEEDR